MLKKTFFFLLAAGFLFLSSCSDDSTDEDNPPGPNPPTNQLLNISVDGVDHVINDFNNTLVIYDAGGGMMAHRMDIRFDIDSVETGFVFGNYGFQNPPDHGVIAKIYDVNAELGTGANTECTTSNSIQFCDSGDAYYDIGMNTYTTLELENSNHHITVTECNPVSHKVSGTFNFKLIGWAAYDTLHCIGSFENLEYLVLE